MHLIIPALQSRSRDMELQKEVPGSEMEHNVEVISISIRAVEEMLMDRPDLLVVLKNDYLGELPEVI